MRRIVSKLLKLLGFVVLLGAFASCFTLEPLGPGVVLTGFGLWVAGWFID